MHLEEERIQRLLHGELDAASEAESRAHLGACPECHERLERAAGEEERIWGLLSRLDHAPPRVDAGSVAARARRRPQGWERWAAVFVLGIAAAGAAYALPGSPLPGWMDRAQGWLGREPAAADLGPGLGGEGAGISVEPGQRFTIAFEAGRGTATVTLTDTPAVVVRARGPHATFTSDAQGLVVGTAGSTIDFDVELPRRAPWVEIRVGGERTFVKEGASVTTEAPMDAEGRYRIALDPPGS